MHGYAKAYDNAYIRGVSNPRDYFWWLDVGTENSWTGNKDANRAVLEGMTDFFHSIDVKGVGLYSTSLQWDGSWEPSVAPATSTRCRAGWPVPATRSGLPTPAQAHRSRVAPKLS